MIKYLNNLRMTKLPILLLLTLISAQVIAQESTLETRIQLLNRDSRARVIESLPLDFDTHHTQGMTRVGDSFFLTAVQVIDRAKGMGKGFLFKFDLQGKLEQEIQLGEGPMFHPGGIDYDGKHIWVSVAEYRANSHSIIYRVNPKSLTAEEIFRFDDHLGGIVSTRTALIGMSWGSRKLYRWKIAHDGSVKNVATPEMHLNSSHFIDYQDGQWIPETNYLVFGGLASFKLDPKRDGSAAVGGIALVDATTLMPLFELPLPIYSERGRIMNQNPFYVELSEKGIQIRFIPDDTKSKMYTVEFPLRRK
ncbi:MAG: DUF6454 family protein [Candidatus Hydrogenedentota bacterium]